MATLSNHSVDEQAVDPLILDPFELHHLLYSHAPIDIHDRAKPRGAASIVYYILYSLFHLFFLCSVLVQISLVDNLQTGMVLKVFKRKPALVELQIAVAQIVVSFIRRNSLIYLLS